MSKYCVIGPNAGKAVGQNNRSWFDDLEQAVAHASSLARANFRNNSRPTELLVVNVVKIIEIGVPQVVVRDPDSSDRE